MKRLLAIIVPAALLVSLALFAGCSNPLENPVSSQYSNPPGNIITVDTIIVHDTLIQQDTIFVPDSSGLSDTVIVVDTLIVTDTLIYGDTIIVVDTVIVTDTLVQGDTVIIVDTVIVYLPDTSKTLCARLDSHRKQIVWLLRNDPGPYRLEFSSFVGKDQPPQKLFVRIDGQDHIWRPADKSEFTLEQDLGPDATIIIWSDHPKACGHSIDICLTITPM